MSVSEAAAMYADGELELHPAFQRFFRWSPEQKTRLIESLVLGIPVPPVFVAERGDSKWDVIDGVQRLSTILEVMGQLKDKDGVLRPALVLTRTHYLPDFEGRKWDADDPLFDLPEAVKIKIKRARLDVNIVRSTSEVDVKFEVFQRLNTGGAQATEQEVRNCLLVMADPAFFEWFKSLGENVHFQSTLTLTDRAQEEAFDLELVTRFMVFLLRDPAELQSISELGSYLNEEVVRHANDSHFKRTAVQLAFNESFEFLAEHLGDNAFRRYDASRRKYVGPLLRSLFEVVAVSLGYELLQGRSLPDGARFKDKHKALWDELKNQPFVGSGVRASTRIPETIEFGRKWIQK
ncbi:MAG: DUF262 domain-containing protein [Verrucomicrobiota bacterium JB022]|nr:DUF262 domain-containing protein [Verrucomicrobiota bacterium JB022]